MSLPSTMRGAMLLGPEHIEVRDVPLCAPAPGTMVLRVRAATTCGTDVKVFRRGGHPRMLKVPTLFGHEVAGVIAAVGDGIENYRVGDAVVISNSAPCGDCAYCGVRRENLCESLQYLNGAFAEYLVIPARFVERSIHVIPAGLSFERAALAEPLACVLHGISACELGDRARVPHTQAIIYGGGPIGLLFVAALTRQGIEVILADPNRSRLDSALRMGAHNVVQIERGGSQAQCVREATWSNLGAEIVIDCTGIPEVWNDAIDTVRTGGLVNLFGGCAPGTQMPLDTHRIHYSEITLKGVYHHRPTTFADALSMLADPQFRVDELLSETLPISAVETALRKMMDKQVLKVVINGEA
jgi:L-iditol 2-dehydrogenase